MPSKVEYLRDPCGTLSIPYHKHLKIGVPEGIEIVHQRDFDPKLLENRSDTPYFRLKHDLKRVERRSVDGIVLTTAQPKDFDTIADIINRSYDDMSANMELIESYTRSDVYDGDLWVMAWDEVGGQAAGCGIADFDPDCREGVLEWIQVLPEYRRRGIGELIVTELLCRMQKHADFATVSGQVDNATRPELLYRKCGFTGDDVWHILV